MRLCKGMLLSGPDMILIPNPLLKARQSTGHSSLRSKIRGDPQEKGKAAHFLAQSFIIIQIVKRILNDSDLAECIQLIVGFIKLFRSDRI